MKRIGLVILILSVSVLVAVAQERMPESITTATLDPATSTRIAAISSSPFIGEWRGLWESNGRSQPNKQMEIQVSLVDDNRVTGKVRVAGLLATPACSPEWERLSGIQRDGKVFAQYDLGGRCGKIDVIFLIDPAQGNAMVGTYKNAYGEGSFRLTKQ